MDMKKTRVLKLRCRGLPNEGFGRQRGGVAETEHKHSKFIIMTSYNKDMIASGHNVVITTGGHNNR